MSEAEFERMLNAVSAAIAPRIEEAVPKDSPEFDDLHFDDLHFGEPPKAANDNAANDNAVTWPFFPFPDGWNGAC